MMLLNSYTKFWIFFFFFCILSLIMLFMKADKAHSWTCMDLYVFATPYRVTWTWYFISRQHTVEFPEWDGKAEYEYVSFCCYIFGFFI